MAKPVYCPVCGQSHPFARCDPRRLAAIDAARARETRPEPERRRGAFRRIGDWEEIVAAYNDPGDLPD